MWEEDEDDNKKAHINRNKRIKKSLRIKIPKIQFDLLKKIPIRKIRKIKLTKRNISFAVIGLVFLSLILPLLINKILNPHYFKGEIALDKTTYSVDDDIQVSLKNIKSDTDKVIIKLENEKGQEIQTENVKKLGRDKSLSLSIVPTKHLKPGRYKIRASDFFGNSIVQDFVWGVLAINSNKSVYAVGEKAEFAMAVLNSEGKMVCDAKVTLTVTTPSEKVEVLSTDNGKLKTTPQCNSYAFSLMPDYVSELMLTETGTYKMHLKSTTKSGDFEVNDSFEVKDSVPFDVERITATRIYPYFSYPVTLKVKANQDFDGKVEEIIPEEFGVTYDTKKNVPKLQSKNGRKTLSWIIKLKKGDDIELSYKYKSPLASPDFYLLGEASFIEGNKNVFEETRKWQIAIDLVGGPTEVTPNADNGAQAWTCTAGTDGNCATGHFTVVDDGSGSPSTSGYISTGTGGSTGEVDAWDMTTFTPTPNLNTISSVTAYIYAQSATNANGGTLDDVGISVFMGGAYQTDVVVTPVFNSWGWFSATFTGSWTTTDLDAMRVRVTRTKQGSGNPGNQDDDVQIATVYATATYSYSPVPPKITQEGYTFENDDEDQAIGDANDSNTIQAGTSFTSGKTLTSVKKGERLTLRMHIKNTASASATQKFGLFYDRNDGIFTKVSSNATVSATTGNCTDTNWDCATIKDVSDNNGENSSIAFNSSGTPWISYVNTTSGNMEVARYVGSGGNGCISSAWTCEVVVASGSQGTHARTNIVFYNDKAYISYYATGTGALGIAEYVGSGGSGCTATSWTCTSIDVGAQVGQYNSLAFDNSGNPWISYQDNVAQSLKVAKYVGSGGSGCTATSWTCTTIEDSANVLGYTTSISIDSAGIAWISYYDGTNKQLKVAKYVVSGGTGCASSSAWTCTVVDDHATDDLGISSSISIDSTGVPWISYSDTTNTRLKVANYVGSGGNCDTSPQTGSDAWNCTVVDDPSNGVGTDSSLAFAPDGSAWISYRDTSNASLQLAHYVGSGGNCTSSAWSCSTIDDPSNQVGAVGTSLAFDQKGKPWISYRENTSLSLKVASLKRGGEITIVPSLSGGGSDSLSASHADMTSATDSSGQSDADCLTATTWNNGKLFESEEGAITIPDGSQTSQCTEIAYIIDTSQAVAGTTYRFVVATDDGLDQSKGKWRGPISVSTNGYPTLTIEPDNTTPFNRYSKDNTPVFTSCDTSPQTGSADWGCLVVDDHASNNLGRYTSIAFDSAGNPWVSFYDSTNGALKVAKYVGSGGNCDTAPETGSDAWDCTVVDDHATDDLGLNTEIVFDPSGTPWISYWNLTNLSIKVAKYVGSGGSCATAPETGSAAWDCTVVDDHATNDYRAASMAMSPTGTPYIAFRDFTNLRLKLARYVGSGGNCDTAPETGSDAWDCTVVDDHATDDLGNHNSIAFDTYGIPWIAYRNDTSLALKVAKYVGSGGNCDTAPQTGSDAWDCTVVDDHASDTLGEYASLAFDNSGNGWISYYNNTTDSLKVAKYVGSGGSCATAPETGSAAWDCTVVDDHASDIIGVYTSLKFDPSGAAWIAYSNNTSLALKVAKYVGSGGNCDTAPETGSDAWDCTVVDDHASDDLGKFLSLSFDNSGVPWISYTNFTGVLALKVAKLHLPNYKSDLRYLLSAGKAPATESGSCSSTTDSKGYCALTADDSDFDSITAVPTERPMAEFAVRGSSNATAPTGTWIGRTNLAPNTGSTAGDIKLEVYRFGTTNAWEALASDTTSANCSSADCTISATAAGTASEYFEADGSNYWTYLRVYQIGDGSTTVTLKNDYISVVAPPTPPTVTTDAATNISATSATLNSTVNPNGKSTDVFYKYDTANVACASLANTTSSSNIGSGSIDVSPNSISISPLSSSTQYFFCAGATNSDGTTYGSKLNFTTSAGGSTGEHQIRGGLQIRGGARL